MTTKRVYVCQIGYVAEAEEAERRLRRGERQLFCRACERWRWASEFAGHDCDPTGPRSGLCQTCAMSKIYHVCICPENNTISETPRSVCPGCEHRVHSGEACPEAMADHPYVPPARQRPLDGCGGDAQPS